MISCHNRSVLAERVHDLLSVVALAKRSSKHGAVHLVGFAGAGTEALLARALAGNAIGRAAIDLDGFDFDRVNGEADAMLLPGGLKYGGIYGFVPLCAGRSTLITHTRETGRIEWAKRAERVTLEPAPRPAEALCRWLLPW
jgi:hypothetical protein